MYKIITLLNKEKIEKEGIYNFNDLQDELLSLTKVYHLIPAQNEQEGLFYISNREKDYDVNHFSQAVLKRDELLDNLSVMMIITDRNTYIDCIEDHYESLEEIENDQKVQDFSKE